MPLVAFNEFTPDQPDYGNPGSNSIRNCLPATKDSYGPMPALNPYSGALGSTCLGSTFMRANDATVDGFAGTATKLYRLTSASINWTDVTNVAAGTAITAITRANPGQVTSTAHGLNTNDVAYISGVVGMTQVNNLFFTITKIDANNFTIGVDTTGYTVYGSAGTVAKEILYSVAGGENWNFAVMDQRVIAVNFNTAPQTFLVGTDSLFSTLSASAPKARYCCVVKDFLMLGNTTEVVNGNRPQRIWWSALGDGTNWPTPGTVAATQVQSDFQDLLGEGGWVQGIVAGLMGADVAIFQERRIWRGTYVGSPDIFSFQPLDAGRGTPIPGSIVSAGGVAYYIADTGFFKTDGQTSISIGDQKIDRFFWADVDQNNLANVSAAIDPQEHLVFWAYPGAGASGGVPNKIMVYDYNLDRFTIIDLITVERLATGMTIGYTLDQTFTVLGYTLDNLPYPLDSRVWTGGRLAIAAFDSNHKLAFFSGPNIAATLDTTEAELNDNGIAYINRAWAECDAGSNTTIQVGYRNRTADPVTWTAAIPINTTTSSAGVRATGRFHRARIVIAAGTAWKFAQGVDFDARKAGKR